MNNLVEEELCRQAFALFDKSGSGTISKTVSHHLPLLVIATANEKVVSSHQPSHLIVSP